VPGLADAERLLRAATGSAAFAVDAWRATDAFLDARLHAVRNQVGQQVIATRMRDLLEGTEIVYLHRDGDPRVQDPYSLRCVPQVYGAVYDTIEHVRTIVDRELGGVTDNPLVFQSRGKRHPGRSCRAGTSMACRWRSPSMH
jgi:histidine ammonia-lyase